MLGSSLQDALSSLKEQLLVLESRARELEAEGRSKDSVLQRLKPSKITYKTEELPDHRGHIPFSVEFDDMVCGFQVAGRTPPESERFVMTPGLAAETKALGFCLRHSEDMVPAHSRQSYRNCDRVEVMSKSFASFLWSRLRQTDHSMFTSQVNDAAERHFDAEGADLEGVWEPYGLNELIRIIRYPHGGHFSPHFDGHYDFSHHDRTFLTCMMYLTDEFDGGETAFLSEPLALGRDDSFQPLLSTAIASEFKPRAGSCIVFSHHVLHQGNPTRERPGQAAEPSSTLQREHKFKWILRTEVCFRRVVVPTRTPALARAMELLDQARAAESHHNFERAQELYRTAFKLHPDLNRTIK